MRLKALFVPLLICITPALFSQVPVQIPLTGNIGIQGSAAILGGVTVQMPGDVDYTLTAPQFANKTLIITSAVSLSVTRNIVAPLNKGQEYNIENSTTGGQSITVIGATGTGVTIANGSSASVFSDGTNYIQIGGAAVVPPAGIPNSTGTSYGTSYDSTNKIPSNFVAGTIGNAATATQLATTPTPCTSGQLAGGIDASGNSIDCASASGALPNITGPVYANGASAPTVLTATQANASLGNSAGIEVHGDSISGSTGTSATGPTNNPAFNGWNFLLTATLGGPFINDSTPGFQVANSNFLNVWRDSNPIGGGVDPLYISEILTNDAIQYGGDANKQLIAQRLLLANLAFMAIPRSNKVYGQSCTLAGGMANQTAPVQTGMGVTSTSNGASASCVITSPVANKPIYACYDIADASVGTLTISVDGVNQPDELVGSGTTFNAFGDGGALIATNGATPQVKQGIACARLTNGGAGWAAGNHTVKFTNTGTTGGTNTVAVEAVMVPPTASTLNNPTVISVTPNQQNTGSAGAPYVTAYQGILSTVNGQLSSDGLNTLIADTATALLNDPRCGNGNSATMFATCYSDTVHPNNTGYIVMKDTVLAQVPSKYVVGQAYQNIYQNFQALSRNTFAPSNPSRWFNSNPYGYSSSSTAYAPGGITLGCPNGQCNSMFMSSMTGFTSMSTGGYSWCNTPGIAGGYAGTVPPSNCPISLASNGAFSVTGALWIATDNAGPQPSGTANASTNYRSHGLFWSAGLWRTDNNVPFTQGPGFEAIPTGATPGGQDPSVYLTMLSGGGVGMKYGLDLTNTTLTNHLGTNADAANLTVSTLNASTVKINGQSYSVVRGTSPAFGGSALTAGACVSSGNITVTASGGGSVVNVSPSSGIAPGAPYIWHGYPTGPTTIAIDVCALAATTPPSATYAYEIVLP